MRRLFLLTCLACCALGATWWISLRGRSYPRTPGTPTVTPAADSPSELTAEPERSNFSQAEEQLADFGGEVLSVNHEQIAGAFVRCTAGESIITGRTNSNGLFKLSVPAESAVSVYIQADGYLSLNQSYEVRPNGNQRYILFSTSTGSLSGTVNLETGQVVGEGSVYLVPSSGRMEEMDGLVLAGLDIGQPVDNEGRFTLSPVPSGVPWRLFYHRNTQDVTFLEVPALGSGEDRIVSIIVPSGILVTLDIRDSSSMQQIASPGVDGHNPQLSIHYHWNGLSLTGCEREVDNSVLIDKLPFRIRLPGPGDISISGRARGYQPASVKSYAAGAERLLLNLDPLRHVHVFLKDQEGNPYVISKEDVEIIGSPGTHNRSIEVPWPDIQIFALESGQVGPENLADLVVDRDRVWPARIKAGIPPDPFRIVYLAEWELFAPRGAAKVVLYYDRSKLAESPLAPELSEVTLRANFPTLATGGVRFQVLDAATQEPMTSCFINLDGESQSGFGYRVQSRTGEFCLMRYPVGKYSFVIPWEESGHVSSCAAAWGSFAILDDQITDLGTVWVAPPCRLRVQVVDDHGKGVQGVEGRVFHYDLNSYQRLGSQELMFTTEAGGACSPLLLRSGRVRLEIRASQFVTSFVDLILPFSAEEQGCLVNLKNGTGVRFGPGLLSLAEKNTANAIEVVSASDSDCLYVKVPAADWARRVFFLCDDVSYVADLVGEMRVSIPVRIQGDVLELITD